MPAKSANGKSAKDQPWSAIEPIDAQLIPPNTASEYWPLYTDLVLRLERTPKHMGLAVLFPDGATAAAKQSLSLLFTRRLGKGAVKVSTGVTREGVPAVFVQRGPNYPDVAPAEARKRGKSNGDDEAEVSDFD